jgi:hypothetical protein
MNSNINKNKEEPHPRVVLTPTSDPEKPAGPGELASDPEFLGYMADLILQLKCMAEDRGYATLGGILEVAYQEAKSQAGMR